MGFAIEVASKVKRIFFPRPTKEKASKGAKSFGESGFGDKIVNSGLGYGVADFGSKDEMFFDSRVWIDSDYEDDFYSVNGEFTPSRGSTPNHQLGFLGTPKSNGRAEHDDMLLDASPTDKKKKLAELLQVPSMGNEVGAEDNKGEAVEKPGLMMNGKAGVYEVEEDLCEGSVEAKKERTAMAAACCIPRFVPGLCGRKQKMSPAR